MTTLFAPFTIEDMLALLPGLNERALKEELRERGCASEIRGKLYVSLEQFRRFLKETELCPSKSNGAAASPSSMALLPANAYEKALKLATQTSQKALGPRERRVSSRPASTEPRTKPHLPTLVSSTNKRESEGDTSSHSSSTSADNVWPLSRQER